jgi:nitrogen fixation NifU-like protein
MDLYAQNIMDHYRHPRNVGQLEHANAHQREANYTCGDSVEVWLNIQGGKIQDLKYRPEGCAISQAAISILSEAVMGKTVDATTAFTFSDLLKLLGVTVSQRRKKCSILGLLAVQNAILGQQGKPLKQWSDFYRE